MATGARLRSNFHEGTLTAALGDNAGGTDTTAESAEFAGLPVVSGDEYLPIVIGNEILHVTDHASTDTTVTVERGQENTTPTTHGIGDGWEHAPTAQDFHEGYAPGVVVASGAALTVNVEQASVWVITLDSDCTFTFDGAQDNGAWSLTLVLTQDATGTRIVTWPAGVAWPGGEAPTLSTDPGATDVLTFITPDGGTTWFGFPAGQAMA